MIQFLPIVLIALGVGLLARHILLEEANAKSHKHGAGVTDRGSDREQRGRRAPVDRRGSVSNAGVEPSIVGASGSSQSGHDRAGQPDGASSGRQAEPVKEAINGDEKTDRGSPPEPQESEGGETPENHPQAAETEEVGADENARDNQPPASTRKSVRRGSRKT